MYNFKLGDVVTIQTVSWMGEPMQGVIVKIEEVLGDKEFIIELDHNVSYRVGESEIIPITANMDRVIEEMVSI